MALALMQDRSPGSGALETVFRAHSAMVFRTAYRLTGNAADAEDVLQTIFLRMLRREDPAEVANEESYLRRAAIHASIDLIRQRGRMAPELHEEDGPAERAPETAELRDTIRHALTKLDARQSEVFTLRFLEGYSNGEIAELLKMSKVRVAVTVHRARQRLQQEINKYSQGGQR